MNEVRQCWDCRAYTAYWTLQPRSMAEDGGTGAATRPVPVHADAHACSQATRERRLVQDAERAAEAVLRAAEALRQAERWSAQAASNLASFRHQQEQQRGQATTAEAGAEGTTRRADPAGFLEPSDGPWFGRRSRKSGGTP